jgi:hypothetical protein
MDHSGHHGHHHPAPPASPAGPLLGAAEATTGMPPMDMCAHMDMGHHMMSVSDLQFSDGAQILRTHFFR